MTASVTPPMLGMILAGGLARRMGGGDKSLSTVGGRPILDRVVDVLAPQCDGVILNANGDPERFGRYGFPVVPDTVPDFAGPLAGVLAALDWAAGNRADIAWVVSVAADTPFLPVDLVERLHAVREAAGTPLACAGSGGRAHPVNAVWPVSLRDDLRRSLVENGERKIDRWTGRHGIAVAEWPDRPVDPFFNVNAPEDLQAADTIAREAGAGQARSA